MQTQPVQPRTPAAIRVRGVKKGFGSGGTRIEVLRGIDLDVYSGEMLLLAGPSGCGKTTLLTVIAGLLHADSGEVALLGQPVHSMKSGALTAFRAANIGFIFQQFNLIPTLTVAENAAIPLLINRVPQKTALRQAEDMLAKVGLDGRQRELPGKLSGGQQQRVAIARALVANPRVLICDEPTAALDGETGAKVMDILKNNALDDGRTVIVVTHDNRIFHYGDRMARMVDGHITSVEPVRKSQRLDVRMMPVKE
jgi:putative ABC transport system ATP-binding protein